MGMKLQNRKRDLIRNLAERVSDRRVLDAMDAVPRERFVPPALRRSAYDDFALPLSAGQTISQPTIVAMTLEAISILNAAGVLQD